MHISLPVFFSGKLLGCFLCFIFLVFSFGFMHEEYFSDELDIVVQVPPKSSFVVSAKVVLVNTGLFGSVALTDFESDVLDKTCKRTFKDKPTMPNRK